MVCQKSIACPMAEVFEKLAEFCFKGYLHNFIWLTFVTSVHLFAMETASLSLFLLAILSANCKKNEN
jgi:hypothetical protein